MVERLVQIRSDDAGSRTYLIGPDGNVEMVRLGGSASIWEP